ncbi:MAG: mechanosensitive ion channel family protein [Rhizobiaceae bacterium]
MMMFVFVSTLFLHPAIGQEETEPADSPPVSINATVDAEDLELMILPQTRDELSETAKAWQSAVKEKTISIVDAKIALRTAGEDQTEKLRDQIIKQSEERGELFTKFAIVIDALEAKGGAPELVEEFRQYRTAVLTDELKNTDSITLTAHALKWLGSRDGGLGILINISVIIFSFLVLLIIARIIRRLTRRQISKVPKLSSLLQAFIVFIIYWLALAVGIMFVLTLLGFDVTPLFAVFGGASFIAAFALQNTLSNLASGLLIMVSKPFDVGDFVNAAGVSGVIEKTNVVSTSIRTFDNQLIIVPNTMVWGSIITNVNALPTRRVDMIFGISYDDDVDKAKTILEELVSEHPLVLKDPAPVVRMNELADSSVNFICRPWAKTEDYWTVYWDLTRSVKKRFDKEGLSIPYPQSDVHIHGAMPVSQVASSGQSSG